jgi:anti-anti-sigma regulatory factor
MAIELHVASSAVMHNAADLRQQCIDALAEEGAIHIDIADVTDADLSFVQILCALRVSAADAGREVRLRTPVPAPVAALLERAGFLAAPTPQDLDFWFHGERAQ